MNEALFYPVKTDSSLTSRESQFLLLGKVNATSPKNFFKFLQFNANGIRNKTDEIQLLIKNTQAETKLNQSHKIPNISHFTPIKTTRTHKQEGGFLTYNKKQHQFFTI